MDHLSHITELITTILVITSIVAYIIAKINNLLFILKGKSVKEKIILILKTFIKSSSWLVHFLENEKNKKPIEILKDIEQEIIKEKISEVVVEPTPKVIVDNGDKQENIKETT